ncbi:MAG: hypothetical protein KC422_22620 [Trueperaceae bacterium]|nr:hypothetical protein [Trueperaceae bacterium]
MELNKKEIAAQLKEAANLLDVLAEDEFRAKAFMNAARQIEAFEGDILDLLKEDRLTDIRGVGKSVAAEIAYLKEQEYLPVLEELYLKVPEDVRDLFRVSGLGSKKISALWQNGISGLAGLIEAVEDGRVAALKGFGAKSAQKFAEAARFAIEAKRRMRLNIAEALNNALLSLVQERLPEVRLEPAGEYRRCCETVESLEFVVTGVKIETLFAALNDVGDKISCEAEVITLELEGRLIHFTLVEESHFGTTQLYKTGNALYLEGLEEKARDRGLELSPEGLVQDEKVLATPDEKTVYAFLGLEPLTPELREEKDPEYRKLIILEDIHGQIHNHSSWSDAVHSIREMVEACRSAGFSYLAMADHSRTSYYANGLSIERVYAQAREIAEIRQELLDEGSDFELLHGIEIDIMTDGSLDYPDEVLDILDYTVVSVHQNFTLSKEDQTRRIVRAVEHPKAKILAHPTGRLLLRRPEYEVDLDQVIDACARTGTVIEINANPYRLDLDWRWVKKAKARGCKFSINPDAHHVDGFKDLKYGVMMARKAGLSQEDVINTAPDAKTFLAKLKP